MSNTQNNVRLFFRPGNGGKGSHPCSGDRIDVTIWRDGGWRYLKTVSACQTVQRGGVPTCGGRNPEFITLWRDYLRQEGLEKAILTK